MSRYYAGEYAEALRHHTEEFELTRKVGNPLVTLRAQIWRVAALAMMGPTDEAVAEARALTVERDHLNSLRESAQAHLFLGDMLADARCTPAQRREALDEYARAKEFAERADDPRRIGWASYKTGELRREAREFGAANEALDGACAVFEQIGDQVGLSMATKVRGQIAMDQGDYEAAERHLLEAHRLLKGLHHTLEEIDVLLQWAELSLDRGERARAEEYVDEIERLRLPVLRPDLVPEFERVRQSLRAMEKGGADR
jgi:tetratricopeptide (TPR) repeat protein